VKLALDLLEFDEPVTKAMWYVCGNTVVTDTLEQAKALAYNGDPKFRVKVSFSAVLNATVAILGRHAGHCVWCE